jgi:hypothetical protein
MSVPTLQVLVGFQVTAVTGTPFQLNNATYGKLNTGTLGGFVMRDLTNMVRSVSINRGRNRQMEQFRAGTASVAFYDPTRILDPLNQSSTYYPFVTPRAPIQVLANGVPIYTGVVTDWNLDYDFVQAGNQTTATCSDNFTVLANMSMNAWTPTQQLSGARVAAVLTRPEVVYQGGYSTATGSSTLGGGVSPTWDVAQGTNVLNYLQLVEASEAGYLFVSAAGTLTFAGRTTGLNPTAAIAFSDTGTGVPYQTLTNSYGDELLYNYVQTKSPAGDVQTTSDATSVSQYQAQQLSKLDLLNSTTTEVAALGNYLKGRYANPVLRFTGVSTQLAALSPTQVASILAADITRIVSVTKSFESGTPSSLTQNLIVTGVRHEIRPGSHIVGFTFESTDSNNYLTLNDPIFGRLDYNLLAF